MKQSTSLRSAGRQAAWLGCLLSGGVLGWSDLFLHSRVHCYWAESLGIVQPPPLATRFLPVQHLISLTHNPRANIRTLGLTSDQLLPTPTTHPLLFFRMKSTPSRSFNYLEINPWSLSSFVLPAFHTPSTRILHKTSDPESESLEEGSELLLGPVILCPTVSQRCLSCLSNLSICQKYKLRDIL